MKYSDADITGAARSVFAYESSRSQSGAVAAVRANEDYSGLVAEVVAGSTAARSQVSTAQDYTNAAGMPTTTVVVDAHNAPTPLTRSSDSAPWQGGGAIGIRWDGNDVTGCSTGFAIVLPSGAGRLLTAAHCAKIGDVMRDGTVDQNIGPISGRKPKFDAAVIDPNASPATVGKVFGGPWNAGTGHSRYQSWVGGASNPSLGAKVCTSGAQSGEHCGLEVTSTSITWGCPNGNTCTGFRIHSNGGMAGASGDSGGPIYRKRSDGRVGASGIISYGKGLTECSGLRNPRWVAGSCYQTVYAPRIEAILNAWDARIEQ